MTRGIRETPHTPTSDDVSDVVILSLWRQGFDTLDIAKRTHLPESAIYNRLLHVREAGR